VIGRFVDVTASCNEVVVWCDNQRVAAHHRSCAKFSETVDIMMSYYRTDWCICVIACLERQFELPADPFKQCTQTTSSAHFGRIGRRRSSDCPPMSQHAASGRSFPHGRRRRNALPVRTRLEC
jgi:hypothetical protein